MKIIVIGGNAAGMSAASRLVRKNKEMQVTVYEKTNEVSYGACGMPYYIAGFNDNIDLMRIRTPEEFRKSGINLLLQHEVISVDVDEKTIKLRDLNSGTEFTDNYDKLIVASGSSSIMPPFPGRELANVFTLKTLDEAENIRTAVLNDDVKTVAIIGGGYIGLELAEACIVRGKKVHVFEAMHHLLNGFDEEFCLEVESELNSHGAILHLEEKVESILGANKVEGICTNKGNYNVDLVVVAVGVRPNTGFINHESLKKERNGALTVDGLMQTTNPDILAAGDCATVMHKILKKPVYIPLGTNANKQGRFAADTLLGTGRPLDNTLGTAMLRCMNLELAKTGITEKEANSAGISVKTVTVKTRSHARYYPDPQELTIKLCYDAESRVLLGGQLMGKKECALRVNVLACAIDREMTVDELGRLDLGYAPPFASVWDAVHIAANAAK
ncbi:MAG: CoA-disulfide reductase [Clostridiaceae bacterium]|jgi:NADPH-dependent 2,4-dienoyl-CoA reductase/sulfur reductase-like enzyme|nr:CoA-disulfide reductase [Clostridiaceae bacterium]